MNPRILFLVMSAVNKSSAIDQLADALAPHPVLVHHDFSQTPDFKLNAPNVSFVPNPKRTGWAFFGFVDGIFHALQHALSSCEFDYLQLLSPTCLPVKPVREFVAHVASGPDAHFDCIDLLRDDDALMSVGYRAFTPEKSLRHKVFRRLSNFYFRSSVARRDEAGIWLHSQGGKDVASRLAELAIRWMSRGGLGSNVFDESFRPYCGSTWFGARRHVIAGMVQGFHKPGVRDYFSQLRISDEFLIPSLLMSLGVSRGPMNHHVQAYEESHPGIIQESDIAQLRTRPVFFARKFPDDPQAAVRIRVLSELAGFQPVTAPRDAVRPGWVQHGEVQHAQPVPAEGLPRPAVLHVEPVSPVLQRTGGAHPA